MSHIRINHAHVRDKLQPIKKQSTLAHDYFLTLSPAYIRQEINGIDSKVEEFRSFGTPINTDLGV